MFTGIIEEVGTIKSVKRGARSSKITIEASLIFSDLKIGDSVSTNGVCLTAESLTEKTFTADVMSETLRCSSLGDLQVGSKVNLERAMSADGRFGGHMVSGHIDGIGKISSIRKEDIATWYTIKANKELMRYIILKGSVALDGISLTVSKLERDSFSVSIIPHTAKNTTLLDKIIGSTINVETDIVGKYIAHFSKLHP